MNVVFYTIELVEGVERLMPWRTLIEVAKRSPFESAICSAQGFNDAREYEGVKIYSIDYGIEALRKFIEEGNWNVVYYPIAYRQGLKDVSSLNKIQAKKVAYIPGGLSPLSGSLKMVQMGEVKKALPYMLDTITPHCWIAKKLQNIGFEGIVCQSPLTGKDAKKSGWKKVVVALPGRDTQNSCFDNSLLEQLGLKDQKFVLFSGAPTPTRGSILAMKAFDRIAERVNGTKMVMLMRKDVSSDFTGFDKAVSEMKHKDRFIISKEKLDRNQLFSAFSKAWAVMLPFLVVPSEIPLTFFEVMQIGTPVLTFENGGTTDYLRKGLKIARHRSVVSFAKAIEEICNNVEERNLLAKNAKDIMAKHPSWVESSKIWIQAIEQSV